jgi:hypothetical protein
MHMYRISIVNLSNTEGVRQGEFPAHQKAGLQCLGFLAKTRYKKARSKVKI